MGEVLWRRITRSRNWVLKLRAVTPDVTSQWPRTLEALQDQYASLVIELLCGDLDADLWQVQELLAKAVWPGLSRAPLGRHVTDPAAGKT